MLAIETKETYNNAVAVTPSDTTKFAPTRALYVGTTGNLALTFADGSTVTLNAVPVGLYRLSVTQVKATGTTASNIVAFNFNDNIQ